MLVDVSCSLIFSITHNSILSLINHFDITDSCLFYDITIIHKINNFK